VKIHDWIFEIVDEICYDREYVYPSFVRHFCSLMREVERTGRLSGEGTYRVSGIKSNINAVLSWQFEHRLNLVGSNVITINCEFEGTDDPPEHNASFEMSSGEWIE